MNEGATCFLAGVEEDVIISVLAKRSNEQRQQIKVVYEAQHGEVSSLVVGRKCSMDADAH